MRVNARLDRFIVGEPKRASNPIHVWVDQADEATMKEIDEELTNVTAAWRERYPDGNLARNRLQLTEEARRVVYLRKASEEEGFRDRWEAEAARDSPITPEER